MIDREPIMTIAPHSSPTSIEADTEQVALVREVSDDEVRPPKKRAKTTLSVRFSPLSATESPDDANCTKQRQVVHRYSNYLPGMTATDRLKVRKSIWYTVRWVLSIFR